MYKMYFKCLCLLFLTASGQCRDLFSVDLPEVSAAVLEQGKPLQLPKSYESVQIAGLEGTLYSDSLSQLQGVKELRIKGFELTEIEKGALCSAPDLKILELNLDTLKHVKKNMFENCDHLEELILTFSSTEPVDYVIDNDTFEDLTLKNFILNGYNITHLTKNFFKINPAVLEKLTLATIGIKEIDADVFEDFKNLKSIIIINNQLTHLPKGLFKNQNKLTSLTLATNGLKNLTWDEFEGLQNVEVLNLGENNIAYFDADKIAKTFPNLQQLFIQNNPPSCKQKEAFVEELKQKYNHSLSAEYKFDPGYYDSCEQED